MDKTNLEQDSAAPTEGTHDAAGDAELFPEYIGVDYAGDDLPALLAAAMKKAEIARRVLEAPEAEAETRVSLLCKFEMTALLTLRTSKDGGVIIRSDPRAADSDAEVYETAEDAGTWFTRSLETSTRNGWTVCYDGPPRHG